MMWILRLIDRIVNLAVFLFCLLLLLAGLYSATDTYYLYQSASDSSVLRFRPESKKDMQVLYEDLKGSVCWLTLKDAGVDAPVMQGKDNMEYLNKNPYGEFSLSGSLFLDSRNSADFSDEYSLIYGHHMDHQMMFGALDQYLDEEFLKTHTEGTLFVQEDVYDLEIFAAIECSAYENAVFDPGRSDQLLLYLEKNGIHPDKTDSRILAMSTCQYPDTMARTVVLAWINDKERSGS